MGFGVASERLWDPPKERLVRFLEANLDRLREGPSLSVVDGVVRLGDPRTFTRDFVKEMLVEGFGHTESGHRLVRLEESGCWAVLDDGEMKALVVDDASKELGAWGLEGAVDVASDHDIDWIWLSNGADWVIYRHGRHGSASKVNEFLSASLLDGTPVDRQAERLLLMSEFSVSAGALDQVWELREVLGPYRILDAIRSEPVEAVVMRELATYDEPDMDAFWEVLLSDVGLDAIRSHLVPGAAGLRLPLFTLRAVVEFAKEQR